MLLYIIRHGEPDYKNDTLTPMGWKQAEALARRFAVHGLDRIYSSPLGRAKDTAKPTCELLGLPMETEEWASESHAWEDISCPLPGGGSGWIFFRKQTEILNEESADLNRNNWFDAPCFAQYRERIMKGFERMQASSDEFLARQGYVREGTKYRIERPNNDKVALFCHQGFSMEFLPVLLQIPPQITFAGFDFSHTGVTIFEFRNDSSGYTMPRCLCLSDVSHIYEAGLPLKYNGSLEI